MCLFVKSFKPSVAKDDIKCYKVVRLLTSSCFKSRYQDYIYHLNYPETTTLGHIMSSIHEHFKYYINVGFHSYKNLLDAHLDRGVHIIVECIIPKGSLYYEGIYYSYYGALENYCSNQIIINKIIY